MEVPDMRKVYITVLAIAAGTTLALLDRLDEPAVWMLVGLVTAFAGGNGLEHIGRLKGGKS